MPRLVGKLYGKVADLRNSMYDRGTLKSFDLGVRTISVGNISSGGTGKTPLVVYVAKLLADNGEKVCILTRGYGRRNENARVLVSDDAAVLVDAETGGDEPVELAEKLLGRALVVADANRVAAARWVKGEFDITTFVLDDGFQHRRVKRDLDIVCIDATDPFGNRSILREPISGLSRANAMVITRANLAKNVIEVRAQLKQNNEQAQIFTALSRIVNLLPINLHDQKLGEPKMSFAFCGIGNPDAFFEMLRRNNIELAGTRAFQDHHRYTQKDINDLVIAASSSGADALLTTAKDAVKLKDLKFTLPCFVAEIETVIDAADEFSQLVLTSS
jgi:tetraacyldisaccharide 4'-kinase